MPVPSVVEGMDRPARVVVYGSAAGIPTRKRPHHTAIGLWRGEELYLLDAGEPTAAGFTHHRIPTEALQAVFITHTHADHIGGLPMLLQWHHLSQRRGPLAIYLPAEAVATVRAFLHLAYLLPDLVGFEYELRPVEGGRVHAAAGVEVEALPNRHLQPSAARVRALGVPAEGQSFSYRVSVDGKRVFFSGDLAEPAEAAELGGDADVAIVEVAHFPPEQLGAALAGRPLGRLVLSHIPHTLEPVEEQLPARVRAAGFEGEVYVAQDGSEFVV